MRLRISRVPTRACRFFPQAFIRHFLRDSRREALKSVWPSTSRSTRTWSAECSPRTTDRPPHSRGPSWLTFLGHTKDSLWSIDLFRCESALLRSHWVLVVMDQYTRRIVGFGVHAGIVDGRALCADRHTVSGRPAALAKARSLVVPKGRIFLLDQNSGEWAELSH